MPVQPIPCADGGSSTPGACACAPSIATTPLCRADGTTILLVVQSACAACGDPAADPAVAGWIDPATGTYTPGAAPADAGPCAIGGCSCSPSIATAPMCRADGTTVLVVVRSDCADCDAAASAPTVIGWIDPVAGVFTPGAVPSDVGPCTTDCIDTVCRQLCDDTDGDGAADATYSELYCIKADGTAELVLTYQDDPTVPYTPVAPVDCTYGCPESETVMLCDDTGPFLRRYTFLNGTATYEDVALDGQTPHVVTDTVGACASGGTGPGDVTGCCAPSIASAPLCRADGTTVLLVVRSGCVDCGAAPDDPAVVGWIDAATGAFSAGPAPADAGPCTTGCLDTVCRTRCDDTDGDGAADTTYSELWCIHADGSADLVLTYQNDPSTPYTPTAPVDCEFGPYASQALTLCDDSGPFLRAYTWTGGVASFEDTELDGTTPHVVTGTAGICPVEATACAEQTTPAATLGLCLADGTPIAVVVTRDCDTGTVTQDGWINLTTGTYSAGAPPAGTQACGDSRSIQVSGTFCDVDTAGDVVGLVLIEYSYAADGTIDTVRLVDATTGTTYTPTGTITVCPADAETAADLDLTVLCDVQADGTVTPFVRDYRRDPASGQINGHTDYTLDGAPYTPAGTVDQCAEPCRNTSTLLVCDLPTDGIEGAPTAADTNPVPYPWDSDPVRCVSPLAGGGQALWNGGSLSFPQDTTAAGTCDPHGFQVLRGVAATLQAPRPSCDDGTVTITLSVRVTNNGPHAGAPNYNGSLRLHRTDTGERLALSPMLTATPAGAPRTLTATATVPADLLAAGQLVSVLDLETYDSTGGNTGAAWTADQFTASYAYGITGCETQFLRNVTTDCATGEVIAVTDTTLDGQPYTVTGEISQCAAGGGECCPPGPCRNASTLLLCDLPTDGEPAPTITDTPGAPYYPYATGVAMAGAQTLWDGGTLALPDAAGPQPGTRGTVRTAAAIIQAPRPVCDAGTAHVKVQVDVTQLGPDTGCRATGFLGLYNGPGDANRVALALAPPDTPVGWAGTLTAEADVPAADLAAGNIVVVVAFDAYDDSGAVCPPPRRTAWQLSAFTATTVYDQTGCDTQFLRNVITDCETGAVTAVTDTTLDGQPYTPTGAPGQCTPDSSGSPAAKPCGDTEIAQLCDLTYDPQAPIPTPAGDFTLTGNVVAADGGTTLWFAQANQPANGVAELLVSGLLPTVRYEFRFASAWIGAGAPDPANNNAIYLLEILDGATVLAARNRNVSNGSNVFPGGALTEDLPPLAFIAPATGAVTVRFTDQTTGGPVNDRDLFLKPLEVRTEALTVQRTPFLRRFTFGCDGDLTSTEDLGLDGVTPYAVQGEVGSCAADGEAAGTPVTPCDVQNVLEACRCDDADGDGVPEVGYVELLGVDCTGTVTSLGTYTSDLNGPYSPIAPMDCNTLDDEEGAEPVFGAQARRVELTGAATWSAAAWPTLQSVTAVAHGGTGTITTADGPSTLHQGEAATWSIARDEDARLTGPLVIAASTGTVTVTFTTGVQL